MSRRGAYLALLTEYPQALHRVLSVLGGSRWAAGYLIRHPQLLDELLDDEAMDSPFDWPEFKRTLRLRLAAADGVEQQMDLLRHAHQAEVFRILLIDLAGKLSVEHVSDRLSELADAVLDVTLEAVWNQLAKRHREVPKLCGDRVRQAGRQGARLRVRPRRDLPLRRSGRCRCGRLRHLHPPPDHLADDGDRRGHPVRRRLAAAAERRVGPARHRSGCVPPLSTARRRRGEYGVGLGAPGVEPRALLRGRRRNRREVRSDPRTGADARRARPHRSRRRSSRCASASRPGIRTIRRCSI